MLELFQVAPSPAPVSVDPFATAKPVSTPLVPTVQKSPIRSMPFPVVAFRFTLNVFPLVAGDSEWKISAKKD